MWQVPQALDIRDAVAFYLDAAPTRADIYTFGIYADARLVGQISLHDIDWHTRESLVAYHLFLPDDRGRGIGTIALMLLQQYVRTATSLTRVFAIRTLHLADGRQIGERLEQLDTGAHTMQFTFADTDTPFQNYHCTVQVQNLGDGRSEISWSSVCEPRMPEAEARRPLEGAYRAALVALQQEFGA